MDAGRLEVMTELYGQPGCLTRLQASHYSKTGKVYSLEHAKFNIGAPLEEYTKEQ
jgi:hypothetical protein